MKQYCFPVLLWICFSQPALAGTHPARAIKKKDAPEPAAVYLLSYTTAKNNHKTGLHFAWSTNQEQWHVIGNEYGFLLCDYGRWDTEKRMADPYMILDAKGNWHCIWELNRHDHLFAHAASTDLINWGRQAYIPAGKGFNCLRPIIQYNAGGNDYSMVYADSSGRYYRLTTKDFKAYSPAVEVPATGYSDSSISVFLDGSSIRGQVHRVGWEVVDKLIKAYERKQYTNSLYSESAAQDAQRFAGMKPVEATITLQPAKTKPISKLLMGIFFEDLNYAADGGLYAELVQNRDFEYAPADRGGKDSSWNSRHSWMLKGENTRFTIDSANPVHPNNPHYAVLQTTVPGAWLQNNGFDGISLKKGERYNVSVFARQAGSRKSSLLVKLVSNTKGLLAREKITITSTAWKKMHAVLVPLATAADARLELEPLEAGTIHLDMVSLFPEKTFKNHPNGLRTDLAQAIADIHPRFVRFPGGCLAHGDGLANIYRWKNSVGPLESRKPQRNIWGYHQTTGLGYFEYFQFCEDIGAEPVPVVAAGVSCQNSSSGPNGGGQQGGIPMNDMDAYVQDILDLVEYANGDAHTVFGKMRADAGHPAPFNLKYIGVGNEDLISDVFEERFTLIFNALRRTHPEITVIGTVGPSFEGTDYREGWAIADRMKLPLVDEHYYQSPGWFIHNQDYYDRYDRSRSKVYLGEYAAHLPGRPSNIETALAEALYLTALERNADVVSMASYAPLLAKQGHTQWTPDLIYFNDTTVLPTVDYYVQQLYGHNAGDKYIPSNATFSDNRDMVKKRISVSAVRNTENNHLVLKLVNLLPVPVNTVVDLQDIRPETSLAEKTVLQGRPDDASARPVVSTCAVSGTIKTALAPYSFTVLNIPIAKD